MVALKRRMHEHNIHQASLSVIKDGGWCGLRCGKIWEKRQKTKTKWSIKINETAEGSKYWYEDEVEITERRLNCVPEGFQVYCHFYPSLINLDAIKQLFFSDHIVAKKYIKRWCCSFSLVCIRFCKPVIDVLVNCGSCSPSPMTVHPLSVQPCTYSSLCPFFVPHLPLSGDLCQPCSDIQTRFWIWRRADTAH